MDSGDPRMALLQKWSDEGLLAKAGFVNSDAAELGSSHSLGVLIDGEKVNTHHAAKGGKRSKQKGHQLTPQQKAFFQALPKERQNEVLGITKGKAQAKKHHQNPYLIGEWLHPGKLSELKTLLFREKNDLNVPIASIRSAIASGSITIPSEIKSKAGSVLTIITRSDIPAGMTALDGFKEYLAEVAGVKAAKFRMREIKDTAKISSLHKNIRDAILLSKFMYLIIKFIEIHHKKQDDRAVFKFSEMKALAKELDKKKANVFQIEQGIEKQEPRVTNGPASATHAGDARGRMYPSAVTREDATHAFDQGKTFNMAHPFE